MAYEAMIASNDITLIDGKNVITDEYEISKKFNEHYINIVGKSSGTKLGSCSDAIDRIIE